MKRGLTVAGFIALTQALVLIAGWILVYKDAHKTATEGVEKVMLQDTVTTAKSIVKALGGLPSVDVPGSEDWERTQEAIENLILGGNRLAYVLDSDGNISCHPDIRDRPKLRDVNLGIEPFLNADGVAQGTVGSADKGFVRGGLIDLTAKGLHYLATIKDPNSKAQLVVHQPVSRLAATGTKVTSGLLSNMLVIGGLLVGLTAILALVLTRAHDLSLASWNDKLEDLVGDRTDELLQSHRTILFGISKLAEHRDTDTGQHVERICQFTGLLADEWRRRFGGLTRQWIQDARLAASMHDIGKVSIPDSILLKPGPLTNAEFTEMKLHTEVGERALMAVRNQLHDTTLLDIGIEIAGGHHERWDGTGYPRCLRGENIPLSARIVAVADVFDALMSKRPYRDPLPFEEVVNIIHESAGSHFDPMVIECFDQVSLKLRDLHATHQDLIEPPPMLPHLEESVAERAAGA
ncbi:MAG: HD domain-containing protein [bacterium]|nr:HD domain-containing protein [bacterium]